MSAAELTLTTGGGKLRLDFDLARGSYSIRAGDITVFAGARSNLLMKRKKSVERFDTEGPWEDERGQGPAPESLLLHKKEDWGRMLFSAEAGSDGALVIRAGLQLNEGAEPPSLDAIVPLLVPAPGVWPGRGSSKGWRAYVHGWQCWTPTGALKGSRPGDYLLPLFLPRRLKPMLANPTTPVSSERGHFESEWFSALADTDAGDSVLVGFTGVTRALSRVMVGIGRKPADSEVEARCVMDGTAPRPGEQLWSEPLAIIAGDLTCGSLEAYASMVAAEQGVEEVRRAPSGWCSWYQYFTHIDRAEVAANLEGLSGKYSSLGVELVQVDDGYSPAVGDWLEVNDKFADGMASLAQEVAAKDRIPGIWVAPFTVTRASRIFRERKDWLQKDRKGKLVLAGVSPDWRGRYYGLDLTHPEVLERIAEVFTTLAGWGYRFFKLDFMACGLLEGQRRDPGLTRAQAARRALEVIRESVGDDSYIMAAGGPILLGVGILDAHRLSGDVAPFWRSGYQTVLRDRATPGVRNSIMNTMTRSFMSGRIFDGDPDCLMTRSAATKLTDAERRTLASVIAVLGGSIMISDDLALWGAGELELAAKCFPHAHGLASTPDLWRKEIPELMTARMADPSGDYVLAIAVNWFERRRDVRVALDELGLKGRWHVCEYWSGEYLGETDSDVLARGVEPHGCALLKLTAAADEPRLIGSSVNLSQGAAELTSWQVTEAGVSLTLRSPVECGAVLTLSLPGAGDAEATTTRGEVIRLERLTTGVYRARFEMERFERIEIIRTGA
jgi:alpha-galactosidase